MNNFFLFIVPIFFIIFSSAIEKSKTFTSAMRGTAMKRFLFAYSILGAIIGIMQNFNINLLKYNISFDLTYYFSGMISIFIASYFAFPELRPKDIWEYWERSLCPDLEYQFAFQHSPFWLKTLFNISFAYTFLLIALNIFTKKETGNIENILSSFWTTWFIGFAAMLYPSGKKWIRNFR